MPLFPPNYISKFVSQGQEHLFRSIGAQKSDKVFVEMKCKLYFRFALHFNDAKNKSL